MAMIGGYQRKHLRTYLASTLPAMAVLQRFGDDGQPVAIGDPIRCRVVYPRARQGVVYPDDQRQVEVLVPAETEIPENVERVVVDGSAHYRVTNVPPYRADDLLRTMQCVEARGAS